MQRFQEWLDSFDSSNAPKKAITVNLPKVKQGTSYSCGAACLYAVSHYFGKSSLNENKLIKLLNSDPCDGTLPQSIVEVARSLGLKAFLRQGMTIDTLKSRLEKGIPVICALQAWGSQKNYQNENSGHYVVAIGFDENRIYFEDPLLEKTRAFLDFDEFVNRWHDKDAQNNKYNRLGISIWAVSPSKNSQNLNESVKIK